MSLPSIVVIIYGCCRLYCVCVYNIVALLFSYYVAIVILYSPTMFFFSVFQCVMYSTYCRHRCHFHSSTHIFHRHNHHQITRYNAIYFNYNQTVILCTIGNSYSSSTSFFMEPIKNCVFKRMIGEYI